MGKQGENGLSKLFGFRGQTIDVPEQVVLTLKYLGLHDELGKKINVSETLIAGQRRSGWFLSFMMMVHPSQYDTKCKQICMTCREFIQLPLYLDGIDSSIDTKTLTPHILF